MSAAPASAASANQSAASSGRVGRTNMGPRCSRMRAFRLDQTGPPHDLHSAARVLGERRAAFNPIAVVAIENAANSPYFRVMDMAADDAVEAARARFAGERLFEIADEAGGVLHLQFEIGGERPIGQADAPPHGVENIVRGQRKPIGPIAEMREPARIGDDAVELIAMDDEKAPPVGGFVNGIHSDLDARERQSAIIAEHLVVIAGHIDDARAVLDLGEDGVEHARVRGRPEPILLQPPAIDDVADKIERLAIIVGEEVGQKFGFTTARAQMDVGNKKARDDGGCDGAGRWAILGALFGTNALLPGAANEGS